MINRILDKINTTIECYEHSMTDENEQSIKDIIYGMTIAKASIVGELKNERGCEN